VLGHSDGTDKLRLERSSNHHRRRREGTSIGAHTCLIAISIVEFN
jgi:hypothetical protein